MDIRNYIRPLIAGLVGIGLIVLIIIVLMRIFSGGKTTPSKVTDLGKFSNTDAVTTLTIDAPTRLDQDHRQVKIAVSQSQVEIDIVQGYQGNVIATNSYANNSAAYGAFLQSLKLMNYAKGNNSANSDERGYCPQGERYIYQFESNDKQVFRYWTTSCGQGTFGGNRAQVLHLFERQVPERDFARLTNNIPLGD